MDQRLGFRHIIPSPSNYENKQKRTIMSAVSKKIQGNGTQRKLRNENGQHILSRAGYTETLLHVAAVASGFEDEFTLRELEQVYKAEVGGINHRYTLRKYVATLHRLGLVTYRERTNQQYKVIEYVYKWSGWPEPIVSS